MSAHDINRALEDARARGEAPDFDAEKTVVVDAEEALGDDAPTMDYDPTHSRQMIPSAPATPRIDIKAPVTAPRPSESGKRRSSRRTVRIPNDSTPKGDGDEPTIDPATERGARWNAEQDATPDLTPEDNDEITIVRPLKIINIGSDPPPPITSHEVPWPPPERPRVVETAQAAPASEPIVQTEVPNLTKTDLLPPPLTPGQIPEAGWTPTPAEVAKVTEGNRGESVIEDRLTYDGDELLEDVEPDATPLPPRVDKKPPPPPKKEERGTPITDPPQAKKVKGWFEDMFAEDYLRTIDELEPMHVKREVDFIEDSLGVEKQAVILDLGCGTGKHTVELSSRGYKVVGIDLSPTSLARAHAEAKERSLKPSFIHGDMRELSYEENFDGAYCWSTTFGYFDDQTNIAVLQKLHRALRKGGMLLLDVVNRDYVAPRSPSLVWFEGAGCVCMDDMYVDFLTSRLRVKRTAMFDDGHSRELEYHIRLYTLSELGKLLHDVGFKVVEVSGHIAHPGVFFGTESPRLIVLAERS